MKRTTIQTLLAKSHCHGAFAGSGSFASDVRLDLAGSQPAGIAHAKPRSGSSGLVVSFSDCNDVPNGERPAP